MSAGAAGIVGEFVAVSARGRLEVIEEFLLAGAASGGAAPVQAPGPLGRLLGQQGLFPHLQAIGDGGR